MYTIVSFQLSDNIPCIRRVGTQQECDVASIDVFSPLLTSHFLV